MIFFLNFCGHPTNSFSSGTSADSIPPLPPLPTTTNGAFPMRPGVISSIENRFSASFLASSSKPDHLASRLLQNKHKTLTRAHSDSTAVYGRSQFTTDRDSQLIGVTSEHHLGPQCVIKRKINFESDDAFIKTFQLGCPPHLFNFDEVEPILFCIRFSGAFFRWNFFAVCFWFEKVVFRWKLIF